ncbi:hypothetical protein EIP91_007889 [Steccherinum ochraceum]|uniref:Fungal lipase-type domain-containing protein n=1 Tax=Steccherinum ochraceum TaxID=92696 RepID=A0A4R0R6A5_9APHY|nr:hypothetical protein EIP91_007889 [Steccherinum ochraceum]
MVTLSLSMVTFVSAVFAVYANPLHTLHARQGFTALTPSEVASFRPYTFYASAAYCEPSTTINWSCGANCDFNPSFQPVASGGDGFDTPFWYVGFDSTLNTVIVAHQGTNTVSELEDADFTLSSLDPTLFPGIPSFVEVHDGFKGEHANTASAILSAVQLTMSSHPVTHVTMVSHSLGAAIALLDSVFLPLHLPSGTTFRTVGYGMPRVGNQAFANYVDQHVTNLNRVNNKEDVVPILPGMFLGFHHASGELHILDSDAWVSCPGKTVHQISRGQFLTSTQAKTMKTSHVQQEMLPISSKATSATMMALMME